MQDKQKIKALIIDDSALMRQVLTAVLQQDPEINVVGTAANPLIAREKIKSLKPDVLTLDVEMPGMDGITFLEKLMRLHPLPVVMVSSHTERGAAATLRALDLGAVDFVAKPQGGVREGLSNELVEEIRAKVRAAAGAHVRPAPATPVVKIRVPLIQTVSSNCRDGIIVIGASAGGTQAISEIMAKLPRSTPGIAIVQHMPPRFTASFAERLHQLSHIEVREAKSGDRLKPGVALVAPGGFHMEIMRAGGGYAVRVFEGEPVNRHRPSVDVLFDSTARVAGPEALGIILTGMGSDGARGLHAMKMSGAYTIAQDEKSCVVFGMPEQAIRLGGACQVAPLERMADYITAWSQPEETAGASPHRDKSL
ncbi:chemotaxis protein [Sulfuricaulis limicola]|uniref:Protein-glutamate methylesterase/protein-glutamine glutaminase n=1 Tax=Sulfuricaulis limicola TaxID=1620215 RepID=A0A1B4XG76_9GAMM|nr:chemotaxis response regulator protein-glutamate methylesterase [Sulfuricaulis limicola]BAV33785.1 chemotaxis protein [Sulfuricaulis limicola]